MRLDDYQAEAAKFAGYGGNAMYALLGLAEEAGEVAGKAAKFIRHNDGLDPSVARKSMPYSMKDEVEGFRQDLSKELGDVLWMVAAVATEFGLSLDDVAADNLAKLTDRRERGVIDGSGDNR